MAHRRDLEVAKRMSATHMSNSQEPVFALLADPATHGGAAVKRIDTHAASVFLAGERAYKVKRAVRFPFLDYSTLEKRKAACEAELRVNRPFAPEIYRRVVPITRGADGRLALDGAGTPVEWAVEMRRFDENATLDRLADAGKIDAALADALGRAVAAAHAGAAPVDAAPWIKALADYIEEHVAAFGETPELFPAGEVDALARASRAAYARIHPLLVERGRRGLIRRIHGDLHLGNIVLIDGRPVLFDAIEFGPLIASGDVLYDLAFLLMDLTERGLAPPPMSCSTATWSSGRAEDLDALAALPLFLSLRAAIRAKVTAARLAGRLPVPSERAAIERSARRVLRMGARASSRRRRRCWSQSAGFRAPANRCSRARSPRDSGRRRARWCCARTSSARPARQGRAREAAGGGLCADGDGARLCHHRRQGAPRGRCRPFRRCVDAVFAKPRERRGDRASPRRPSALRFCGLFLDADLETRLARVGTRSRDASDADAAVARRQENYKLGELAGPASTPPARRKRRWPGRAR